MINQSKRHAVRYGSQHPPIDIQTAETRIEELVEAIAIINSQLGSKDPIDPRTGNEWVKEENIAWRRNALKAQSSYIRELKFLKRWVIEERTRYEAKEINVDYDDPKSLIHVAYVLLGSLRQKVSFTDEEAVLMSILKRYLHHK